MDKEQWNQFILKNRGSFLQSWQWADFQESVGHKVWRIEQKGLKALVIKHNLPYFGNYLYCPRGPVADQGQETGGLFGLFLDRVQEIAKQEKSIFFKLEPSSVFQELMPGLLTNKFNFQVSQKQIQPLRTVVLDLTKSEQDLFQAMHQKTRYNIRLAQKKGVQVHKIALREQKKAIGVFFGLLKKTAQRDKFYVHVQEHYQNLMEILGKDGLAGLFLAEYQNQIIGGILNVFWGKKAVYLHGASDYEHRQVMAPYLLQYKAILEAKKQGFQIYDFWGIDESKWPGLTRFKKGFSREEVVYPGAFDLVLSSAGYFIYNLARKVL